MEFSKRFKSKFFSYGTLIILVIFMSVCNRNLEGKSPIIEQGPLVRVSPIPGPANPDPILQNLEAVMNNWFQPPFYVGLTPFPSNYLGGIFSQFNMYTQGFLAINPVDDKFMLNNISQNAFRDRTGQYGAWWGTNVIARSKDGGSSWHFLPPVEQVIPLGGTLSQRLRFSALPGLQYHYAKNGKLYAWGVFEDMPANPPNLVPMRGVVFSSSENNGETWVPPNILQEQILNPPTNLVLEPILSVDPANSDYLQFAEIVVPFANLNWAYPAAFRSKNGGRTWSCPKQNYDLIKDRVWFKKHFDPDFTSDPLYFTFGGDVEACWFNTRVDENVLLTTILRVYPRIGSNSFTEGNSDSNYDRAVIRSLDNGKTWQPVAGATDQYINAIAHDPAGASPSTFPFSGTFNFPAATYVSPFTGRVYMVYQGGNPAAAVDPLVYQFYPYILLSVSSDKGASWEHAVKINQTPTNISFEKQQAFIPSMIITKNGYVLVSYYDFRNWTGTQGENRLTTSLEMDLWIAVYKETPLPCCGSTGVGLDFVEEIRVTPHSFNARIGAFSIRRSPTGNSIGAAFGVNNKNEVFITFSMATDESPFDFTTGYRGMQINTNNLFNTFIQRYKFNNPSNR